MSGSTLHASLTALSTLWTGVVTGLQVSDGPIYDPDVNYLAIGWAGKAAGTPGTSTTRTASDAARDRDNETTDVACLLAFHVGDPSQVRTVRADLFSTFDALAAALSANRGLGVDGVKFASITAYDLEQDITETGSYLYLHITVQFDANK